MRIRLLTILAVLIFGLYAAPSGAQSQAPVQIGPRAAPTTRVQVAPLPPIGAGNFDAEKATAAYLSRISAADRARSDAYFEGGYVLQVVDLLYALVLAGLLLWPGLSAAMRGGAAAFCRGAPGRILVYGLLFLLLTAMATLLLPPMFAALLAAALTVGLSLWGWARETLTKFAASRFMQVPVYVVQYLVVSGLLMLPLAYYEGFVREHHYGLSNQTFGQWAGEFAVQFGVQLAGMILLLTAVYAVIRVAKRAWWIWGAAVTVGFMIFALTIGPVYISPLTNHYTPLPQSGMRNAILSLARANAIPADDVYTFDASKQSNRISANVSGMFGTTRISLNDNLLNRGTPSEVLAVLGHEMGHYALGHIAIFVTWFGLLIVAAFWFVDHSFRGLTAIFGGNWDVRSIDDPAGLPAVMALISVFFFLATPVTNTIIRTSEVQADIFGLNAVRQPDAFATVSLKVAEYRKLDPSPLEEFIFFDHPSGKNRILMAMRWKAEHLGDPDIATGQVSPQ
jgi:STE24 endopeptidase